MGRSVAVTCPSSTRCDVGAKVSGFKEQPGYFGVPFDDGRVERADLLLGTVTPIEVSDCDQRAAAACPVVTIYLSIDRWANDGTLDIMYGPAAPQGTRIKLEVGYSAAQSRH